MWRNQENYLSGDIDVNDRGVRDDIDVMSVCANSQPTLESTLLRLSFFNILVARSHLSSQPAGPWGEGLWRHEIQILFIV